MSTSPICAAWAPSIGSVIFTRAANNSQGLPSCILLWKKKKKKALLYFKLVGQIQRDKGHRCARVSSCCTFRVLSYLELQMLCPSAQHWYPLGPFISTGSGVASLLPPLSPICKVTTWTNVNTTLGLMKKPDSNIIRVNPVVLPSGWTWKYLGHAEVQVFGSPNPHKRESIVGPKISLWLRTPGGWNVLLQVDDTGAFCTLTILRYANNHFSGSDVGPQGQQCAAYA